MLKTKAVQQEASGEHFFSVSSRLGSSKRRPQRLRELIEIQWKLVLLHGRTIAPQSNVLKQSLNTFNYP